ncbi:MAG: FecR domain-containing protein [Planctomycetota bacterium]
MDREQWIDRLTETCLGECLGGKGPPDLSGRVLARADRSRRRFAIGWAAAAAAALLVAGLISVWWPGEPQKPISRKPAYAEPAAIGDYRVEGDGTVRRGAIVHTDEGTAELSMGGYAYVTMEPGSSAQIAGTQNAEEVVLTRGEIDCEVNASRGRLFAVRTELGTVSVVGTRFTVQLTEEETEMNGKKMLVNVLVGTVLVTGLNGAQSVVSAGERRAVDRGGQRQAVDRGGQRQAVDRGVRAAMTRLTTPTITEAKTPLEKEAVALALQERALQAKQQEIETKVLADAEVAAAMKAAFDAMAACEADVNANPEYADLKKEREQVSTELRQVFRGGAGRQDRANREERMRKFRELQTRSNQLREKMAKLTTEVKELAGLKKKKDEAVAAFLTKYQATLAANKEHAEIDKQLKQIEAWSAAISEQLRAERTRQFRANREERRGNAGGAGAEEGEKKEGEVDNPFEGL